MFTSLDKIDIELKPLPDGRAQYIQTDHRTKAEIEEDRELSVLFVLIRVLNPKRHIKPGFPEPVILYSILDEVPNYFGRAIHSAGGEIIIGGNLQTLSHDEPPIPLDQMLDQSFKDMARAVAKEYNVALNISGVETVEHDLAKIAGTRAENELAYWSSVVKLGSFAGEVIRASNDGRWVVGGSGTLPISLAARFQGDIATVNPIGKAIKRFENGDSDSLTGLVELIQSSP